MKKFFTLMACLALCLMFSAPGIAETSWPEKSVQVIVPWAPGGGSDLSARIIMDKVSKILGQPVVITNITGAAGLNGALRVNNSRPDGYTILWEHPANLAIAPTIGKAKYTWKDFDLGGSIGTSDIALIVKKDSKYNNIDDVIKDIQANPGQVKWSYGANSASHFTFLGIQDSKGKLDIIPIAAGGDKPRIINVMNGVADVTTAGYAAVEPYVKSGDVKIIAMASPERSVLAPDYPTLKEHGIDAESVFLYTAEFPKGTPKEIVEKFQNALKEAAEDPEVVELLKKQGIVAKFRDADETRAIWDKEAKVYDHLARANGLIK